MRISPAVRISRSGSGVSRVVEVARAASPRRSPPARGDRRARRGASRARPSAISVRAAVGERQAQQHAVVRARSAPRSRAAPRSASAGRSSSRPMAAQAHVVVHQRAAAPRPGSGAGGASGSASRPAGASSSRPRTRRASASSMPMRAHSVVISRTELMPSRWPKMRRMPRSSRPAAVAVHDDRDVLGERTAEVGAFDGGASAGQETESREPRRGIDLVALRADREHHDRRRRPAPRPTRRSARAAAGRSSKVRRTPVMSSFQPGAPRGLDLQAVARLGRSAGNSRMRRRRRRGRRRPTADLARSPLSTSRLVIDPARRRR